MAGYTLRQLEYFVAVAEVGTVTGAAAQVHLSQSAMSTALADLERSLGVQLLLRHHARGITLTPAGERLLAAARQLIGQAEDLQAMAGELGDDLAGHLTLGCFAILAPFVLPPVLAAIDDELPGLYVATTEEPLDRLETGLLEGRLELAIGYDLGFGEDVERVSLFSVAPHLVVPVDHRLAGRKRVSLHQLGDEPMVLLDLPHSRDYFAQLFAAAGAKPNIRYRTHSAELARALVARGLAYTVLNLRPDSDLSLEGRPYLTVPLDVGDQPDASLRVVLLRPAGSRPTRRAKAVADLCRRVLAEGDKGLTRPR
jgi:DNA-binding transcriptional LysR family regulator